MRRLYGPRKIDARAPQSAADSTPSGQKARATGNKDDTPSGRQRYNRENPTFNPITGAVVPVGDLEGMNWRTMFRPEPVTDEPQRPMARMAPIIQPPSAGLDIAGQMLAARQAGATSGSFRTPYGTAAFNLAPATPPDVASLQSSLSALPPAMAPATTLSAFAQKPKPSVLSGASKWLAPI